MLLTTLGLISAGVALAGSAAGSIGAAANRRKAQAEETRAYKDALNHINTQYYRDPLSTIGNRSLLKRNDEQAEKQMEAMENRAVAGGATFENQLAARQSLNEVRSDFNARLLQGEDARRQQLDNQRLALNQNHSLALQNNYAQAAQDWQSWGQTMSNAAMSVGNAALLGKANGMKTVEDLFK